MSAELNTIKHGDCVSGMNALPAGTADLVFADPPFNIGYEYDVYDDQKEHAHYIDWSRQWIKAVHRLLKPSGAFWLAIGDEYAAELKIASQDIGFHCRSWVIWYYTFGVNCSKKFTRSHAHLFHFVKDKANFTFRDDDMENRVPSARQLVYADSRANSRGRLPDDTWILRPQDMSEGFTPGEDTWYFPRVAGTFKERAGFHGCQMPEQLLARIIRTCSHPGEVVVDPFSGSATTVAVAKKLGRNHLGFDLSPDYVRLGLQRLEGIRRGDPLNGAPEPRVSAPATGKKNKGIKESSTETASDDSNRLTSETEAGLLAAFGKVHDGFSVDRVVADPELSSRFAEECSKQGLFGDHRTWNRLLFRLRKAGRTSNFPTTNRTSFTWEECDPYLFASEIALQRMLTEGVGTLDDVLCDPALAERFDKIARIYAPNFTSLQYRWAALKLRKESKDSMTRAALLTSPTLLNKSFKLSAASTKKVNKESGLYLINDAESESIMYIGEALNLRERLSSQLDLNPLEAWDAKKVTVQIAPLSVRAAELLAYQCLFIQRYMPRLNYKHRMSNEIDNGVAV